MVAVSCQYRSIRESVVTSSPAISSSRSAGCISGAGSRIRFSTWAASAESGGERDLRPAKTSRRLRSEKTTRDRYAIRGYAPTAAKHRRQIFTAIRDALAGNPWIPSVPGTA